MRFQERIPIVNRGKSLFISCLRSSNIKNWKWNYDKNENIYPKERCINIFKNHIKNYFQFNFRFNCLSKRHMLKQWATANEFGKRKVVGQNTLRKAFEWTRFLYILSKSVTLYTKKTCIFFLQFLLYSHFFSHSSIFLFSFFLFLSLNKRCEKMTVKKNKLLGSSLPHHYPLFNASQLNTDIPAQCLFWPRNWNLHMTVKRRRFARKEETSLTACSTPVRGTFSVQRGSLRHHLGKTCWENNSLPLVLLTLFPSVLWTISSVTQHAKAESKKMPYIVLRTVKRVI